MWHAGVLSLSSNLIPRLSQHHIRVLHRYHDNNLHCLPQKKKPPSNAKYTYPECTSFRSDTKQEVTYLDYFIIQKGTWPFNFHQRGRPVPRCEIRQKRSPPEVLQQKHLSVPLSLLLLQTKALLSPRP